MVCKVKKSLQATEGICDSEGRKMNADIDKIRDEIKRRYEELMRETEIRLKRLAEKHPEERKKAAAAELLPLVKEVEILLEKLKEFNYKYFLEEETRKIKELGKAGRATRFLNVEYFLEECLISLKDILKSLERGEPIKRR